MLARLTAHLLASGLVRQSEWDNLTGECLWASRLPVASLRACFLALERLGQEMKEQGASERKQEELLELTAMGMETLASELPPMLCRYEELTPEDMGKLYRIMVMALALHSSSSTLDNHRVLNACMELALFLAAQPHGLTPDEQMGVWHLARDIALELSCELVAANAEPEHVAFPLLAFDLERPHSPPRTIETRETMPGVHGPFLVLPLAGVRAAIRKREAWLDRALSRRVPEERQLMRLIASGAEAIRMRLLSPEWTTGDRRRSERHPALGTCLVRPVINQAKDKEASCPSWTIVNLSSTGACLESVGALSMDAFAGMRWLRPGSVVDIGDASGRVSCAEVAWVRLCDPAGRQIGGKSRVVRAGVRFVEVSWKGRASVDISGDGESPCMPDGVHECVMFDGSRALFPNESSAVMPGSRARVVLDDRAHHGQERAFSLRVERLLPGLARGRVLRR